MDSKVKFGLSSSEFKQNESKTEEFNKKALWVNICLMTVAGLQISIYYTSIWPYLKELDPSVSIDFLGWVIAAASIGQSIASPVFGYWNQKTHSVIQPVSAGFSVAIIGQLIYLLLPWFPSKSSRWIMLGARCLTGMGTG
ncbi:hypothetical protein WR25_26552 [Diploscapter pachys]|uniref:Major facilitator superfamily (MFS) profile domain-containing protein n=1 Tax=Diploscapter pachys TaxID=2018661 RepID=A0A2A2LIH1_9BILA|nr:hypothetical protein WR25_26552 [Diploscapter pachys]